MGKLGLKMLARLLLYDNRVYLGYLLPGGYSFMLKDYLVKEMNANCGQAGAVKCSQTNKGINYNCGEAMSRLC